MKRKQKEQLRSQSTVALLEELNKRKAEISQLAIQITSGKTKNTSLLKTKRDELAVVETILQENSTNKPTEQARRGDEK